MGNSMMCPQKPWKEPGWCCIPEIPAPRRQRKEECSKFNTSSVHVMSRFQARRGSIARPSPNKTINGVEMTLSRHTCQAILMTQVWCSDARKKTETGFWKLYYDFYRHTIRIIQFQWNINKLNRTTKWLSGPLLHIYSKTLKAECCLSVSSSAVHTGSLGRRPVLQSRGW